MGEPDLDLRPPKMKRNTMHTWTQECPHCGYVADDFNRKTEITQEFLKSDEYQNCENTAFKSKQAKIFYREYLIAKKEDDLKREFYALLHCAWACDDADDDNAVKIRRKTVEILESMDMTNDLEMMKADLLRRSKQYARVIDEYSSKTFSEEKYNQICTFQVIKSKLEDDACYTLRDAVKDSANNMC